MTAAIGAARAQPSLFDEAPCEPAPSPAGGIERRFDVGFVARLALKEKQIQQNVRPIIAVHKWFARRPGTLFRALLLAEFAEGPLVDSYFEPHDLTGVRIADPFMGGGTPLFEANRLGCDVTGWDVNPMAYWIVRQELSHLDVSSYLAAAREIEAGLRSELGGLYFTRCLHCGDEEAPVKYFLWVKVHRCASCTEDIDLYPGYLLAADERHPKNVLICGSCGGLTEAADRDQPGACSACGTELTLEGPAGRGRCRCPGCGGECSYPHPESGPPRHRMIALEYHCWRCKPTHVGRFFKSAGPEDLERYARAEKRLSSSPGGFVPDDPIPPGDESDRLLRWGYRRYREMFNARQLLGLSLLAERIAEVDEDRARHALATNLSDLLRYQNMLCRYDTRSLKSLDIFSVHGFPVGLIQCESNLLGIQHPRTGTNVGSGGWSNVVEKFARAKAYCDQPFEIRYEAGRKRIVPMPGEWIGDRRNGRGEATRSVELRCASSTATELPQGSLDAVLTDPPYFANVQYAELMDFCYVWLRRLVGRDDPAFRAPSTHREGDLTGNQTLDRGLEQFVAGLSEVYSRLAGALVTGRPFAFTYHHNSLEAYQPVAVALLDAGLVCTASLPCPAEMGGSIHIHGSSSSIVDTVFVCRSTGRIPLRLLATQAGALAELVASDLDLLRRGGVVTTRGDARCITFGHLTRLAVWRLRGQWDRKARWGRKLETVARAIAELPAWEGVLDRLHGVSPLMDSRKGGEIREPQPPYAVEEAEVVF